MKIGIIGAGTVGTSLGKALKKAGHEIMFSSRDPQGDHAAQIQRETGSTVGSVAETLAFSPVIVLALNGDAIVDAIQQNSGAWRDKIIIDLNNRITPPLADSAGSVAQDIARLTGGRVVKAFNTIGAEHFQNPVFEGQKATMFIAGDDTEAKRIVGELATAIGFDVIDAGGLEISQLLENLARLWIHLAYRNGQGRDIAFRLLHR